MGFEAGGCGVGTLGPHRGNRAKLPLRRDQRMEAPRLWEKSFSLRNTPGGCRREGSRTRAQAMRRVRCALPWRLTRPGTRDLSPAARSFSRGGSPFPLPRPLAPRALGAIGVLNNAAYLLRRARKASRVDPGSLGRHASERPGAEPREGRRAGHRAGPPGRRLGAGEFGDLAAIPRNPSANTQQALSLLFLV